MRSRLPALDCFFVIVFVIIVFVSLLIVSLQTLYLCPPFLSTKEKQKIKVFSVFHNSAASGYRFVNDKAKASFLGEAVKE